ncbi:MAG: YebC/PmpR family DNA-binding transcriptional regulator [Bacteroidota bacterium]
MHLTLSLHSMAGHNKWSKIKRQKAATDAKKSKAWARITRDIMVAAREGGGDAGMNPKLALAIDKAKAENMPKDNVERAIKRGTGEIAGADYEEMTYEGYGPHGIAVYVETLTDNTNRTVSEVRHAFSKAGGNLGTSGSVAFQFDRKGILEVPAEGNEEDDLFLLVADAGAEDLRREDDVFVVTTPPEEFAAVRDALEAEGLAPTDDSGLQMIASTTTKLAPDEAAKVLKLLDRLEDLDDVQAVYSTLDMDDETMAALA